MLTAADVMTTDVITVTPETPVRDIATLLHARRISGVPVVNPDNSVVGIVSEGDLIGHADLVGEQRRSWWLSLFNDDAKLARHYAKTHGRFARDVMTEPVITVAPTASLAEIAKTLEDHRIKRIPVIRNGKLEGIVTRGNLVQTLATADVSRSANLDDRAIRERLLEALKAQPWAPLALTNIVVQDGVVHLSWFVSNEDERHALRVAAENVPGVKGVQDNLRHTPARGEVARP
jgi:CBS domain-containing protein